MTYALDNLVVIAPGSSNDERLEDWLAHLSLAAKLRPLQDFAPAFSKRPLSVNVSAVRPTVSSVAGRSWPEIVSGAGSMVDAVERGLSGALMSGAAVWLEATAEQTLAASFSAQSFGGERAISLIVLDLTPGAILRFLQPLGRQALKRICASFDGSGIAPYFMARERSGGEALLALGVPTILDVPSLARCVPRAGPTREEDLNLSELFSMSQHTEKLIDSLCERVLELCDLRASVPVRVTVKGTVRQIVRAGAFLEDMVRSRIVLHLKPAQIESEGASLDALRASPLLDAAFRSKIEAGADSDPDAMDRRHIRESSLPERWTLDLSRRLADQIGHGLKDISLGDQAIQLDVRP